MSHPLVRSLLMTLLLSICTGAWAQAPSGQTPQTQQDNDVGRRKPSRHSGLPVVGEFERQPEPDADEARRQIREKQYGDRRPTPITDPGALLNGEPESTTLTIIDYGMSAVPGTHQDPPGIPVSNTAVVIGTVLSGKTFINKNHTTVYSDYQVRLDEILKPDPTANLAVGDQVVASRPGGAIHFPSGHTTYVFNYGHGLPEIGSQYILFLFKTIPNIPAYEIAFVSGYQLKNGRVYPLDAANEQYYDAMSASVFLDIVKKAIVASQTKGAKP